MSGLLWPANAAAQSELFGADSLDASIDLRASVVDGETGWLDGGFGKLREGGDEGDAQARLRVAGVDLAWKPQFNWNLSGLVSVTHQDGQSRDIDLNEAFLKYRSDPGPTRYSFRIGAFWPPVSQEHSGSSWLVTDSITPSAANSWIGEEVKVLGLEGQVERRVGGTGLSLTLAAFRHNDMSGTLLTYRGWALHDVRMTVGADFPLPPLSPSRTQYQDQITSPFWEVDGKTGYYGRLDIEPALPVSLNLFRYDNRGDRVSSYDLQTSWRTRFWNVGAMASIDDRTTAKAQVMWGNTLVGPDTPYGIPGDVDFATAYLLVSRDLGGGRLSGRLDVFEADDNSFVDSDNNNETGWSAMLAYKHPFTDHAELLVEVLHVDSDRPARVTNAHVSAEQEQTMLQAALRLGF